MTDICTGWTVNRSVKNKAAIWVLEALSHVTRQFPFPIKGIDSDNGSEFIIAHLLAYCTNNRITFTRSRSGNKNDGAYVERKNWTHVRELVGYLRYDSEEKLLLLNKIWELNTLYTNYLCAQQKLLTKQRNGTKVKKSYDKAQSPFQRANTHVSTTKRSPAKMDRTMAGLKPGELCRRIQHLTGEIEVMALSKAPAPIKPRINTEWNSSLGGHRLMRQ